MGDLPLSTERLGIRPLSTEDAATVDAMDLVFVEEAAEWVASQTAHQREHGYGKGDR